MSTNSLWAGRFTEPIDDLTLRFTSSVAEDGQLYREDIAGSLAHAAMLVRQQILTTEEGEQIAAGLNAILGEIESGAWTPSWRDEDIHMAIESRLTAQIGPTGGKLHTARSRNDQVALDERLWLRRAVGDIRAALAELQSALVDRAEAYRDLVLPGYTHLQRAQPVLLGHHLLAYVEMLSRDDGRFADGERRNNRSPLGAAALAGTPFPIDRAHVADALGFDGIVENSMDAVSDRDGLLEFLSAAAISMMHLSRMCEELVLWSTTEFNFVRLPDAFTTGSSIMPQKKNPDVAELIRGKVGRVYGSLIGLLTTMKGLPLAYNRDMQEDKGPALDAARTLTDSLRILAAMWRRTEFNRDRFTTADMGAGYLTATEIADYLVRRGLPFRDAHHVTGRAVALAQSRDVPLTGLTLDDLRTLSDRFEADVFDLLDPAASVNAKQSAGSTSPAELTRQLARHRARLSAD